jgi:hypothetical protein
MRRKILSVQNSIEDHHPMQKKVWKSNSSTSSRGIIHPKQVKCNKTQTCRHVYEAILGIRHVLSMF